VTVLYFADTRFPIERANGAQTMATCHALARRGHDVTLVVRPDTRSPARDPFAFYGCTREPRLTIRPIASSTGAATRRVRYLLAASRLATTTAGVVYTRDLGLAACLLQIPARRRPRLLYESHGIADVVSAEMPRLLGRSALAPSASKLARLARRERRVWSSAAAYVTITRALAGELTERFGPRERVFVVPDGTSDASVTAAPAPPPPPAGGIVAGYAGHLYPWKGVDVLIRALALTPDLRGLIVGGHPGETDRARVEQLARDLGLADRVTFTGLVAPADVAGHLARAAILVLPNTASAISERYTSPLKLFEYLALGRPIVASDLPAIREVVGPGEAVLVPPGDPRALAAALTDLAADPARAASLAAAGRALAPQYTWSARALRLEAALAAVGA
jgi:glycosyltransferase involved in cell wall biosynthesis